MLWIWCTGGVKLTSIPFFQMVTAAQKAKVHQALQMNYSTLLC